MSDQVDKVVKPKRKSKKPTVTQERDRYKAEAEYLNRMLDERTDQLQEALDSSEVLVSLLDNAKDGIELLYEYIEILTRQAQIQHQLQILTDNIELERDFSNLST